MTSDKESFFLERIYPHFEKLCILRRAPGKEQEVVDYITQYSRQLSLSTQVDEHGNIAAFREASEGLEHLQPLLFQGHMDMVCVPDESIFPVKPLIENGWIHTEGTSLGADNGIAVALMLELMKNPFTKNPPLEFLFTVQEEIGLLGASLMNADAIKINAPRLINIDSEEIDFITVGCSGGTDCVIFKSLIKEKNQFQYAYSVKVTAAGGHSGLKIHEKIPNAIKIAAEFLLNLTSDNVLCINDFNGGFAINAIPAQSNLVICCNNLPDNKIEESINAVYDEYKEYDSFSIDVSACSTPDKAFTAKESLNILNFIAYLPHGVIKTNLETGGVLSSVNLGLIATNTDIITITMNIRSSDKDEKNNIFDSIRSLCSKDDSIRIELGDSYPCWRPDMKSELLKKVMESYESVRSEKPGYLDIHAGLECGILMDKIPGIKESVSIGPNLHNAHSIYEKLEISSTVDVWNIILNIINKYCTD
jgi:dipeptidase D